MPSIAGQRIVFLARRIDTPGGVERHAARVAEELANRGMHVTIFAEAPPPGSMLLPRRPGIDVVRFPVARNRFRRIPKIQTMLLSHWRALASASLVHCHDSYTFIHWWLPFRLLLWSKPVWITFHGYEGRVPPARMKIWQRHFAQRLTRGNICVGSYIESWYGTKANVIVYGAVDKPESLPPPLRLASPKAAFLGRLASDTGALLYLDALRMLQERGIRIETDICGDGPLRESCERYANAYALPTRFHGAVPNPIPWLEQSDLVFASGYLALLESMSLDRLAVALYDNPLKKDYLAGLREAIGADHGGFILAESAQAAADAIESAIRDPDRSIAMARLAGKWAREQTWSKLAQTYIRLWTSSAS
ncbi:MAG: Glycosyl transferases group 1 [candidate division BRC1 bacterium ADurb.BinA364]|nr:MAG: Glycosyl transferases group 1 [candidate division BRC1 bacterium ADurb.BinA364]